ncbi:nucleotide sugar dehydrogenase [Bradyrhizobium sp. WSM471]|uniref:nucleotide sugar dehydrogenase n=1 Tax=Bradyrhizobium sp. WSM471 TaxID=319017 RepID=UPI00024D2C20|nr:MULTISPECIES: nucleotide sugar dehydrogenase [Bradyrhizobium]EHR04619.1 nucleotide sugar dehydrogenase [Bradyrhizobium sp. WSM471]UFW45073.1 nucleotide sugar dehydrogenase [Bradyrhizobium canariense]
MRDMQLIERLRSKRAVIGIVGLGYVGLPLALRFCEVGYKVIGLDIDPTKIDILARGESYIEHIEPQRITNVIGRYFEPTSEFAQASRVDALILCVPTPLNKYREPDLSFVIGTIEGLLPFLHPGMIVSLESTTYPGTTDEELKPRIEQQGLVVGQDIYLVFSPEREDPGNKNFSTQTIPKICGGHTARCLEAGLELYGAIIDKVVPVSSTRVAELTKLLENIHRSVNIGLVNEMKILADKMGIDIHEVIRAAATKPFGFVPYQPGPGIGGHCIPIDPFYLTWKAREYGMHTRFIELAGEINSSMPDYVVGKIVTALNQRRKAINGSKVLVLGIAYKKNVDDVRESPSVFLMEKMRYLGAVVAYSDPHVPVFPRMREHHFDLTSTVLTEESVKSFDCIVLATDHDKFDYEFIKAKSRLLVDCRGKFLEPAENIIKA